MEDVPFEFPGKLKAKLITGYFHIDTYSWRLPAIRQSPGGSLTTISAGNGFANE